MDLIGKLFKAAGAAVTTLFEEEIPSKNNDKNYAKGIDFERYIANLFDPRYFSLYNCTRDTSKNFGIRVESDSHPDLTMKYIKTEQLFSIECKFRSHPYNNAIQWARPDQIRNYQTFEYEHNIPTFVVIGLGGTPNRPERMFCLPIKKARYPELFLSTLEQYERPPERMFFWRNNNLK